MSNESGAKNERKLERLRKCFDCFKNSNCFELFLYTIFCYHSSCGLSIEAFDVHCITIYDWHGCVGHTCLYTNYNNKVINVTNLLISSLTAVSASNERIARLLYTRPSEPFTIIRHLPRLLPHAWVSSVGRVLSRSNPWLGQPCHLATF
jgi:hypothetical protein